MQFRQRASAVALVMLLLPLTALQTHADGFQSAESGRGPQFASFGIMGAVARPGVYQTAVGARTLADLVRAAGGITTQATGELKILRGVEPVQQVLLQNAANDPVLAGDLVVVEGRTSTTPVIFKGAHASPAAPSHVQIGLLNVVDRPVIVKVHSENASITRLCEILGQSAETAESVRVVPFGEVQTHANTPAAARRLQFGGVLIFAQGSIDPSRLPKLDDPIVETSRAAAVRRPQVYAALAHRESSLPSGFADREKEAGHAIGSEENRALPPARTHSAEAATESELHQKARELLGLPAPNDVSLRAANHAGKADSRTIAFSPTATLARRTNGQQVAFAVLLTITGIAALIAGATVFSILRRSTPAFSSWLSRLRGTRTNASAAIGRAPFVSGAVIPPAPADVSSVVRPFRVNAAAPMTRLGLDLEMTRQAAHSCHAPHASVAHSSGGEKSAELHSDEKGSRLNRALSTAAARSSHD